MSLLDRLKHEEEPGIAGHQFFAALIAFRDGQLTRAQIESLFNIDTEGADAAELDFIITGYNSASDKGRYLDALHAVFMLLEHKGFDLTKPQIQTWLTAAEA